MGVQTHKKFLISKGSYRKVFNRTEAVFDMGTFLRLLQPILIDFRSNLAKSKKSLDIEQSNHCMPVEVLTHKNSLVSKESYRKVFDRTEFFLICTAKYDQTYNVTEFFLCSKKSFRGCSHMSFGSKNFFILIVKNITETLQTNFDRFLMYITSVRSKLLSFYTKKKNLKWL